MVLPNGKGKSAGKGKKIAAPKARTTWKPKFLSSAKQATPMAAKKPQAKQASTLSTSVFRCTTHSVVPRALVPEPYVPMTISTNVTLTDVGMDFDNLFVFTSSGNSPATGLRIKRAKTVADTISIFRAPFDSTFFATPDTGNPTSSMSMKYEFELVNGTMRYEQAGHVYVLGLQARIPLPTGMTTPSVEASWTDADFDMLVSSITQHRDIRTYAADKLSTPHTWVGAPGPSQHYNDTEAWLTPNTQNFMQRVFSTALWAGPDSRKMSVHAVYIPAIGTNQSYRLITRATMAMRFGPSSVMSLVETMAPVGEINHVNKLYAKVGSEINTPLRN